MRSFAIRALTFAPVYGGKRSPQGVSRRGEGRYTPVRNEKELDAECNVTTDLSGANISTYDARLKIDVLILKGYIWGVHFQRDVVDVVQANQEMLTNYRIKCRIFT